MKLNNETNKHKHLKMGGNFKTLPRQIEQSVGNDLQM
uniref:Uncharacterized protein n=1 Tax=Rhizophora mucronata TaxID=61149 RepID=A0A2P2K3I7_RHIMU